MDSKFRIRLCSDLKYEEMVADICYDNHTIATISQEKGVNNMEIEFIYEPFEDSRVIFLLDDYCEAIQCAKNFLIEMKKNI